MVPSRMMPGPGTSLLLGLLAFAAVAHAATANRSAEDPPQGGSGAADDLLIVHCSLPGQIRQLGRRTTYLSARQPVRTTALDCRVRGGEYVVHDRANIKTALNVWLEKAQAGDPDAETTVGEIFEQGLGVPPDYAAAAEWYQRAAEGGFERALINLGFLYEQGHGVPRDAARALDLYRQAAGLEGSVALEPHADVSPVGAEIRSELSALRARVAELEGETGVLESELSSARQRLSQALAEKERAASDERTRTEAALAQQILAGPAITLIDPPLPSTRAAETRGLVKVSLQSTVSRRLVIGQVRAPAGLLSLTVNDQPAALNPAGVFKVEVPVDGEAGVHVAAIDQQGKRADLHFAFTDQGAARSGEPSSARPAPVELGRTHALLIGNNQYRHLPDLLTPINDVRRLARVLSKRYGFETTTLENASRYEMLSALNALRERLTPDDNLLVYYAGHGELDETNRRGHWLPVDAEPDSTANWVSNVSVTDVLNVVRAKQVLLMVDSCYSGTLTRSSIARLDTGMTEAERRTWLEVMARKRARVVLTSGGLAPVLDFGGGEHSVFARALIEVLESNGDLLTGRSLHQAVAARVAHAAADYDFEQLPEYAPIARAGHEAGDFFLLPM